MLNINEVHAGMTFTPWVMLTNPPFRLEMLSFSLKICGKIYYILNYIMEIYGKILKFIDIQTVELQTEDVS